MEKGDIPAAAPAKRRSRGTKRICDSDLVCTMCNNGKTYSSPYAVVAHQRTCAGAARPIDLTCPLCNKVYANKYSLAVHQAACSGPPAPVCYTCAECGKTFGSAWNFKRHGTTCRGVVKRTHTCARCGYSTARKYLYARHVQACKVHRCKHAECAALTFASIELLNCHLRIVHRAGGAPG